MRLPVRLCAPWLLLSLFATPAVSADVTAPIRNRRVVLEFYEAALNQKNFTAASRFLGPRYVQHNPAAEDGAEGLAKFLAFLRANYPRSHSEIKRVFTDGDFVILHVWERLHQEDRGNAIIDVFRLENGRIVEHWDVKQAIPERPANSNRMF